MPAIRMEQVSKSYKEKQRRAPALQNVDLTIQQGEFVFFVGSRGAGKSTLLRVAAGELRPDQGKVYFGAVNLYRPGWKDRAGLRDAIGAVFQDDELHRGKTVWENMTSGRKAEALKARDNGETPAEKALSLVGMAEFGQAPVPELSFSQCRRVQVARAIMLSPDVLILDEVTDQIDDDTVWDLMHLVTELNARGTTILMATSNSQLVNAMRKRVITLSDGKIVGDVKKGRFGHIPSIRGVFPRFRRLR